MDRIEQLLSANLYGSLLADLRHGGDHDPGTLHRETPALPPTVEAPIRHELVARLRQQIQAGTYAPDPMQIAQAMLVGSRRFDTGSGH
ncbi:MAG: flagellar biosynthesis anti-sigma factor FlgM [Deltaproteobacteria bacterium]